MLSVDFRLGNWRLFFERAKKMSPISLTKPYTASPLNVLRSDDVIGSAFLRKTLSGTGV